MDENSLIYIQLEYSITVFFTGYEQTCGKAEGGVRGSLCLPRNMDLISVCLSRSGIACYSASYYGKLQIQKVLFEGRIYYTSVLRAYYS